MIATTVSGPELFFLGTVTGILLSLIAILLIGIGIAMGKEETKKK